MTDVAVGAPIDIGWINVELESMLCEGLILS